MNIFFVSQRQTYREEHSNKYLWAPQDNVFHHNNMARIKTGDVISQYNGSIVGVGVALKNCYSSPRPNISGFEVWGKDGYKVDVEQYHFNTPVNKDNIKNKLINVQPGYHAPLNVNGGVNQGYLFEANIEMMEVILEEAARIDSSQKQTDVINSIREKLNIMEGPKETFVVHKKVNETKSEPKDEFKDRYINSLLAKPFVILTGNSGTGKTRIATQFAKSLEKQIDENYTNHLLIPVGADWTDNTKILGYYNPLADKGNGKYEKTPIIEFIERANDNPTIPFFLILDEMNLSHVERYFSDFLSKMELVDYKNPDKKVFFNIQGYGKLEFPKNLFITGTVNIDETTYMFSPKVLDRANVIEFKPKKETILDNLVDGTDGGEFKNDIFDTPEDFINMAKDIHSGEIPEKVLEGLVEVKTILEDFYDELEICGFEFAYRTVKEIRLFTIALFKTSKEEEVNSTYVADIQVLQKILPKLHGNRKQIGDLLDKLENLCTEYTLDKSLEKITQMKTKLNKFQYASFI